MPRRRRARRIFCFCGWVARRGLLVGGPPATAPGCGEGAREPGAEVPARRRAGVLVPRALGALGPERGCSLSPKMAAVAEAHGLVAAPSSLPIAIRIFAAPLMTGHDAERLEALSAAPRRACV